MRLVSEVYFFIIINLCVLCYFKNILLISIPKYFHRFHNQFDYANIQYYTTNF